MRTIAKQVQTGLTGKPFNIVSYALQTMMVAQVCDLEVGDLFGFTSDDFTLEGYQADPSIAAPIAV